MLMHLAFFSNRDQKPKKGKEYRDPADMFKFSKVKYLASMSIFH